MKCFKRDTEEILQFIKFSIVGTFGFVVDVGGFYLFHLALNAELSRLASFMLAVVFTYLCNRVFTFKIRKLSSIWQQFPAYFLSMLGGGTVNLLTFLFLNTFFVFFTERQYLSIAIGSVAGLFFNFILSKIIFSGNNSKKYI